VAIIEFLGLCIKDGSVSCSDEVLSRVVVEENLAGGLVSVLRGQHYVIIYFG